MEQTSEPRAHPALTIHLFGPMDVRVDGRPLPPLYSRKGYGLLALLTLRHDFPVERAWLARTLWPDSDEERARFYVRRELGVLRKALGSLSSCLRSLTPHTLTLDLSCGWADVVEFDRAVAFQEEAVLEQAVSLYHGPLLEGFLDEWVIPERDAREQAYLSALETLAEKASERGQYPAAIDRLRDVVRLDPFRECAQRSLMKALFACGDSNAALQVYRDLRVLLRQELSTEPDAATQALFAQIRAASCQPAPSLRSCTADLPTPRHRLPHPLSALVGREEEIEELKGQLKETRLLTLTGAGGIGKTRLAIALGEEVSEQYAEGVWFVELAALSKAGLVAQAVASALGVREESSRTLLETLEDFLAGRRLLLILDNCEHLLENCAHLAETLLQAAPSLHILATSRQSLGVTGEVSWRVPSLSVPTSEPLPSGRIDRVEGLLGYDAVRLFVERARQVQSAFAVTEKNVDKVVDICHRLDGIPLAIELAAARVKAMGMEQIAERLDDRFHLLNSGSRTAPARQQTLQATLDWSYALLSEEEKRLLGRLSVFAGGWTLEAAESVCSCEAIEARDVLDLLSSLVDKSLVVTEAQAGRARYGLMETVRAYAVARLAEAGDRQRVDRRHLDFYLALAEEAMPELSGPEQATWLDCLGAEHDNIRAALEWSLEADSDTQGNREAGLRLLVALGIYWDVRAYFTESRHWLEAFLDRTDAVGEAGTGSAVRATALNNAGIMALRQPDIPAARALFERSLAIRRELGDSKAVAGTLNNLGLIAADTEEFGTARALYEEALDINRKMGNRAWEATNLHNMGNLLYDQGEYAAARPFYEESLAIRRELGDLWTVAGSLSALGNLAYVQKDYETTRALYWESLAIRRELGDRGGMGGMLTLLSILAAAQGLPERAARLAGAAEALREVLGTSLIPMHQAQQEQMLADWRAALGEEALASAWAQGRAMSLEQVMAYALEEEVA